MDEKSSLKSRWDKCTLEKMYHQDGMSLTDIGKQFGCSRQYVQLIFKSLNIPRRTKAEAIKNRPRDFKRKYDFNAAHDEFIIQNYQGMTDQKLAQEIGKPSHSVTYRRLIILGKKKIARRNFTPDENNFILNNYKRMTDIEIARILNRSLISITHHRNRILNRPKRNIRSYTEHEDDFIRQNYLKMTDHQLASVLKRSKASISIHRSEVLGLGKTKKREHMSL